MRTLPFEVCHCILQHLGRGDLRNCALVCKAWLPVVQTLLYTNVILWKFEHLEQFHQTVNRGTHLGKKVKSFDFKPLSAHRIELESELRRSVLEILTTLFSTYLPNLECILDVQYGITYTAVKQALIGSRLKNLRRIENLYNLSIFDLPVTYMSCALLMNDRLENLYILDCIRPNVNAEQQVLSNRLFSRLGQFSHLKEITVQKETNESILLLEEIVESCLGLEGIVLSACISDVEQSNSKISIDSIVTKFTPRANVKSFTTGFLLECLDDKLLAYIMHKFPRLERCYIGNEACSELSEQMIIQFMHFCLKLKYFKIDQLGVNHDAIVKIMGRLWKDTSAYGKERVNFFYTNYPTGVPKECKLSFDPTGTTISYFMRSPPDLWSWKHTEFLRQNGKFLKSVNYNIFASGFHSGLERVSLPDDTISLIFAYCPWIENLSFSQCSLSAVGILPSEKRVLNELSFTECRLNDGILECLSTVLSEVKHLKLFKSGNISMPLTKVNMISFELSKAFHKNLPKDYCKYLKVTHTLDGSISYYKLQLAKLDAMPSTKEEFLRASDNERLKVCCQTVSIIKSV